MFINEPVKNTIYLNKNASLYVNIWEGSR